jgi:beta-phosphoglucomutase-like phosphatase (HAD superfamily)
LAVLGVGPEVSVLTCDLAEHAKPDAGLFLEAAGRFGVVIGSAVVVGDSASDLMAAQPEMGVALLSGGHGQHKPRTPVE